MSDSNSLDLSCFSFRKAFNTLKGPKKTKFRVFEKIKKKYNYFLFQPKAKFRLVDKYKIQLQWCSRARIFFLSVCIEID